MKKKYLLPLFALTAYADTAFSEEFSSQQFNLDGTNVQYVNFSLVNDNTLVDIAASSAISDVGIHLFQGDQNTGIWITSDDDSCLSVDCGLVGDFQFNPLIDDKKLSAGDYTVAIGASKLTEEEARQGSNLLTSDQNSVNSKVLLKIGDNSLINSGEGTGSGTIALKRNSLFSSIIGSTQPTGSTQVINQGSNVENTAQAIVDLCSTDLENSACNVLSVATPIEQRKIIESITPEELTAVASSSVATSKSSNMGVNARLSTLKSG